MRQGRLVDGTGGPFLSVEYVTALNYQADAVSAEPSDFEATVEITLGKGRVPRTPAMIPPALLTALIRAAEAAWKRCMTG